MQKPAGVSPDANPIDMVGQQKISTFDFSFTPFGHQSAAAPQQQKRPSPTLSSVKKHKMPPSYLEELQMYSAYRGDERDDEHSSCQEEIRNSPLFSLAVKHRVDYGTTDFGEGKEGA